MKKLIPLSSKQITSKTKFKKHQSHQISSSDLYAHKNSAISLMTSPSDPKKSLKAERVFSPSEQTKDKTMTSKQKLKSIQIFSPNTKNKAKVDLDIKKSLFDKNPETLKQNRKSKNYKDIENEPCLTSYNERNEKSPFKNKMLNKK